MRTTLIRTYFLSLPLLLVVYLSGCSTIVKQPLPAEEEIGRGHELRTHYHLDENHNPKGLSYLSCDYEFYKKAGARSVDSNQIQVPDDDHLKAASDYFIYALMAANAYPDFIDLQFSLPEAWKRSSRWDSGRGLGFDVWINEANKELVIAYRGTEGTFEDWFHANIAIFYNGQYDEAYTAAKQLKEMFEGYKIMATGHSLGGGLALNVSLRVEGIDAVVFNTSPRFMFGDDEDINHQVVMSEQGEGLGIVRFLWGTSSTMDDYSMESYEDYNYQDFYWYVQLAKEHNMYRFSRGLLITAIAAGNEQAKQVFKQNFDRDRSVNIDPLCSKIFDQ